MIEPVTIGRATLYNADCREVLPTLPAADLMLTDPPYFRVKDDYWDNEWDEPEHFLGWLGSVVDSMRIASNGSLYLFASPQMAARVEVMIRQRMNVLAMVTWNKGARRKGAAGSGVDVTSLRTYWQASSERVIFAEHYSNGNSGVFASYLSAEIERSGVGRKQIAALFPSASGGLTGCVSNWLIGYNCPTAEQYTKIRTLLGDGFLARDYSDVLAQYELERRTFNINDKVQWGDVWDFDPPAPTPGKHPCEKPLPLLQHIVQASSRPGALVADAFAGSGATGEAALRMGRRFIGIERDPHWFAVACKRCEDAQRQGDMFVEAA